MWVLLTEKWSLKWSELYVLYDFDIFTMNPCEHVVMIMVTWDIFERMIPKFFFVVQRRKQNDALLFLSTPIWSWPNLTSLSIISIFVRPFITNMKDHFNYQTLTNENLSQNPIDHQIKFERPVTDNKSCNKVLVVVVRMGLAM
jgi:hypothetical protein